jgi:hypothetical protein
LSLCKLWSNVSQQEWFQRHSTKDQSTPAFAISMSATTPITDTTMIQLTPLAKSFLAMDGPMGGDLGRVLGSIQRQTNESCTVSILGHHWEQLSTLSGDLQSRRIANNLHELLAICLQANLVAMKSSD